MPAESFGVLALAPPVVAIFLAMYTKQVILSLFAGIWVGGLIVASWNPVIATTTTVDWMIGTVTSPWNAKYYLVIFLMGSGAAFIYKSGGAVALEQWAEGKIETARDSQILTWIIGMLIFFDSYPSTIIDGNATRDLSKDRSCSREMHSYVLDSTTAPVTTFGPVSGWIGYQVSMIAEGFGVLSVTAASLGVTHYQIFLRSIPWNIYCLTAFLMVGLISITQRYYGPMLNAEWRSRKLGKTSRDDANPLSSMETDLGEPNKQNPKLMNFYLPIFILLGVGIFSMYWIGGGPNPDVGIAKAFQQTDVAISLLYGALAFTFSGAILSLYNGSMDLEGAQSTVVNGFKTMINALTILTLAWTIGTAAAKVGTANFVVDTMVASGLPGGILPIVIFVAAMLIAFTTGTSWGTMAIVTPLAIPLGYQMVGVDILPVLVAAVFGGAIFGDHCSPISDTTVMSSIFSGADHIDHVNSQIPYALTAAAVNILALSLYAIGIKQVYIIVPFAIVMMVVLVYGLNKWDSSRKNLPEVMPTREEIENDEVDVEQYADPGEGGSQFVGSDRGQEQ